MAFSFLQTFTSMFPALFYSQFLLWVCPSLLLLFFFLSLCVCTWCWFHCGHFRACNHCGLRILSRCVHACVCVNVREKSSAGQARKKAGVGAASGSVYNSLIYDSELGQHWLGFWTLLVWRERGEKKKKTRSVMYCYLLLLWKKIKNYCHEFVGGKYMCCRCPFLQVALSTYTETCMKPFVQVIFISPSFHLLNFCLVDELRYTCNTEGCMSCVPQFVQVFPCCSTNTSWDVLTCRHRHSWSASRCTLRSLCEITWHKELQGTISEGEDKFVEFSACLACVTMPDMRFSQ